MRIVGGSRRGRKLAAPSGRALRPTSERAREALFNILTHRDLGPVSLRHARVIDLYAGTGALGLEALSRGAGELIAVERDRAALGTLHRNIRTLDFEDEARVIEGDATHLRPAGAREGERDFAFLDPPYDEAVAPDALKSLADGGWLRPGAIAIVELGRKGDFLQPEGFSVLDDRTYGAARIVILRWAAKD